MPAINTAGKETHTCCHTQVWSSYRPKYRIPVIGKIWRPPSFWKYCLTGCHADVLASSSTYPKKVCDKVQIPDLQTCSRPAIWYLLKPSDQCDTQAKCLSYFMTGIILCVAAPLILTWAWSSFSDVHESFPGTLPSSLTKIAGCAIGSRCCQSQPMRGGGAGSIPRLCMWMDTQSRCSGASLLICPHCKLPCSGVIWQEGGARSANRGTWED